MRLFLWWPNRWREKYSSDFPSEIRSSSQASVRNLQEEHEVIFALDENGERVGIGADDKNGVWIGLQLLRQIETMKAVLFVCEEKATFAFFYQKQPFFIGYVLCLQTENTNF